MGMEMTERAKSQEPDVLQYTNFRVYLRDYYEFKKRTDSGFFQSALFCGEVWTFQPRPSEAYH